MPTYLIHGFRWPRQLVHIHVILHHLDDAAANWTMGPQTTRTLLQDFIESYPDPMERLPNLRFIEEYDPHDPATKHSPYSYVADIVQEIRLSYAVNDMVSTAAQLIEESQLKALTALRDELCPEAMIEWYVVVCGDVERSFPPDPTTGTTTTASEVSTGAGDAQSNASESGPKRQKSRSRLNSLGRRRDKDPQSVDSLARAKSSGGFSGSHRRQSSEANYRPASGPASDIMTVPPVPRITTNGAHGSGEGSSTSQPSDLDKKESRLRTALKRIF